MEMNYSDENKLSKLNSGGLINLRLNELWNDAHKHSRHGLYSLWNADLDCLWSELGGEYPENSKEVKEFNEINTTILLAKNWNNLNNGFKKIKKEQQLEMARQYILLRRKEMYIRRIQNKQGKGTAYSDGSEDDWE
jgi:hypothetical protein